MRIILLLPIFCLFINTTFCHAATEKWTLKSALENHLIDVRASSNGAIYFQKSLRLELTNKTNRNIQLAVDPALIFRPADTTFQNLVVTGEVFVVLSAHGRSNIDLQTFCGKNYAHAPGADISYKFHQQGDSVMIKVVQFINKNRLYNNLGQNAIWALTNDHNLYGIYDETNPLVSKNLVTYMARLTGWPVPDYFNRYQMNTTPGAPAMSPRVLKIFSLFEWKLQESKMLSLGIYNAAGVLIQPVIEETAFSKGGYKLTVTFEAENIAAGNYYIRLMDGNTVMKEQSVKLD